jgi:7-cyano-7-deazaguanine synthase
MTGKHSLVLCGGGLDSYVAAFHNQRMHVDEKTVLLFVDYGQKAVKREWTAITKLAGHLNAHYREDTASIVAIKSFTFFRKYTTSSLTNDGVAVNREPRAGIASEWVPARNTVLMSLAIAIAENEKFARIVTGINKEAAMAYPDNDAEWLSRFQRLVEYAVLPSNELELIAPLEDLMKQEIVTLGVNTGFPSAELSDSWSCYNGGATHCGECSSCRSRKNAFDIAGYADETEYVK